MLQAAYAAHPECFVRHCPSRFLCLDSRGSTNPQRCNRHSNLSASGLTKVDRFRSLYLLLRRRFGSDYRVLAADSAEAGLTSPIRTNSSSPPSAPSPWTSLRKRRSSSTPWARTSLPAPYSTRSSRNSAGHYIGLRNDKGKDGDQDWKALVEAANNEAWDQFGRLL